MNYHIHHDSIDGHGPLLRHAVLKLVAAATVEFRLKFSHFTRPRSQMPLIVMGPASTLW